MVQSESKSHEKRIKLFWVTKMSIVQFPPKKLLGGTKTFPRKGDNPEKRRGGGVDVENRGLPHFYYFTVQLHLLGVGEK